jgi:hypothetical protein
MKGIEMKKIIALIFLAAVGIAFCSQGAIGGDTFSFDVAKKLYEAKCTKCHTAERPKQADQSFEAWNATIKRMQAKNPGWIDDSEALILIDYLLRTKGQYGLKEGY